VTAILALLKDRRRSQRGSVLSGVLIMTAFIAIISGALMTELSTNFLLSHNLLNRVANEATDNSAIELYLSQLQSTQLNAPCPAFATATVNKLSASAQYVSCWPTIREAQKFNRVGTSAASFAVDGAQTQANGFNDYVVGNSSGLIFDYRFGASSPRWTYQLNGTLTAPPLLLGNPSSGTQLLDVFPTTGAACSPNTNCVVVRADDNSSSTSRRCTIAAGTPGVVSQAGASPSVPGYIYYGDGPTLQVSDISGGDCDAISSQPLYANQPIVAGPIALACANCSRTTDEVYAVVSDNVSSRLVRSSFRNGLKLIDSLSLPWANVAGMAASGTGLPASIAITFGGGGIAVVRLDSNGGMTLAQGSVPTGISGSPTWCAPCGNLFGVGGQNGVLYIFSSSLGLIGSKATGSAIKTSPRTDAAGNWYIGADDGILHELQLQNGLGLVEVERYGQMSQFGSSAQVGSCTAGICIYLGARDGNLYEVPLDARDAVLSACITAAPPACSGANPRLSASVELGAIGSPQTVHVQGWTYYSG